MTADISPRRLSGFNFIGLLTLVQKETGRFLNVYMQTVLAPLVTLFLFLIVFMLALGGEGRVIMGVPYLHFLAPGLLMMAMAQNAFANSSSSLIIAKVQGTIVDVLMPPLSPFELLCGYTIGAAVRGLMIGVVGFIVLELVLGLPLANIFHVILFAILGNVFMGLLGILGGLWSEKFDHMAAVTNFVVTPLTFLSGTFYALSSLPPLWQDVALINPFFYMIDGFRSGFIGVPEASVLTGAAVLLGVSAVLALACWYLLKTGYKIKS
jgi:ABC-2 type transport system permease protein